MDLALNDTQLAVLRWVAAGADLDSPPTPTFKTSAVALRSRGLIELDKRNKRWSARLAEKGSFYLEHGHHPDAPTRTEPAPPKRINSSKVPDAKSGSPEDGEAETTISPRPERPRSSAAVTVPIPSQIRNPHPAIREIVDHKSRLSVPSDDLRRAHLVLHALVQESLRRAWTVTPVLSSMRADSWTGKRERVWPTENLFSIDAGSAPAAVRLRMKQRQVDHVPTKEDIAHEDRYGYLRYPKHDFIPTDKMRLEIGAGAYGSLVIEDTTATRIEEKLERAFARIQSMTDAAVARTEAQRQFAIEEAERRRRAEALRIRAVRYGKWAAALDDLDAAFSRHRELTALVESLRELTPSTDDEEQRSQFERFLRWAEQHLADSNPLLAFELPDGDVRDLDYAQWQRWRSQNTQLFANGRSG